MSSGNRLLRIIIEASGTLCWLDRSHGTRPIDTTGAAVITITRNYHATQASWAATWKGRPEAVPIDTSIQAIAANYPGAMRISYEALCRHPNITLGQIAERFGIPPWPCPVITADQNYKWLPTS